jgi:hypothetical protein
MVSSEQAAPIRRSESRIGRYLRRLGLILFGLALSWFMLEVLMRAAFDYLPPKIQADIQSVQRVPWSAEQIIPHIPWVAEGDFQLRLPVGMHDFPVHWSDAQFTFNTISAWDGHRAGLRSSPPRWPLDVLTFGDSFTFCWTKLEDCWVHRLETDYDWHVFDAGIPGTGTTAQFNLMKEIAPPFKPALVIWQWYNNDVTDDYDLAHIRNETPDLPGAPQADAPLEPQGLARYSAVAALFSKWFNPPKNPSPYQHYQMLKLNGRLMSIHTNEYAYPSEVVWPQNAYGWKRSVAAHDEGAELIKSLGAKLLIVVLPTKEEAYSAYLTKDVGQDYLEKMGETRRMLLQQCTDRGWDCIDALPAFQEAVKNGKTVYYAYDSHLDASGNLLLEDLVHKYIIDHGLLAGKQ